MKEPEIKVTRIKNRWHARLFYDGRIIDEMACNNQQDIGIICKEMLRWFDKMGGNSQYAKKARFRESTNRNPIGKIWYSVDLMKELI